MVHHSTHLKGLAKRTNVRTATIIYPAKHRKWVACPQRSNTQGKEGHVEGVCGYFLPQRINTGCFKLTKSSSQLLLPHLKLTDKLQMERNPGNKGHYH